MRVRCLDPTCPAVARGAGAWAADAVDADDARRVLNRHRITDHGADHAVDPSMVITVDDTPTRDGS